MMMNDGREDPLTTARNLIPLITNSITNSDQAESMALVNSRHELDFELRLASFKLGNDEPTPQEYERLSKYSHLLLEVLEDLVREPKERHLKTVSSLEKFQPSLGRTSPNGADAPELSVIQLPQKAKELRSIAQKMSSLRRDVLGGKSDPGLGQSCASTTHQMRTLEGSHVRNADERDIGNDLHNIEPQQITRSEPPRQSSSKKQTAEEFMRQAEAFYESKIRPLKQKKAIKVAVLDTGVDKGEIHFKAVRGQRGTSLKEVKSFVGCDSDDTFGHGTEVAALVVEMAPHVDLYIAKVCVDKVIIGVDQYVEAIRWAMDHNVHIINISASIDYDEKIEDVISEAESKGIIVFAAASDDEANKPRAFPARMDKVLAVHATDGNGNPCKNNPDPVAHGANISTLGTNIPSPLRKEKLLKGLSFSTAIASGMAANILTLVDACCGEAEEEKRLRRQAFRRDGMRRILLQASRSRRHYDYVCPVEVAEGRNTIDGYRDWLKDALRKR